MPLDLLFRPITPDEMPAFLRADFYGFGHRLEDAEAHEAWATAELDRTVAAFEGDEIVGVGRNYSLELTVPGGAAIPAAGVSWISVLPTHRRRGILTAMMTYLLDDAAERGETVSMLTASEGGIYGRFGYGVGSRVLSIRLQRHTVAFHSPVTAGRVRMVEPEENAKLAPELFERVRAQRNGAVSRPSFWWPGEWAPKEFLKQRFDAVYERDGRVDGYVVYNIEGDWQAGFAEKVVAVHDFVAATPEAEAALWQYLCEIDLTRVITAWQVPHDTQLPWLLRDSRQVRAESLRDWLWLRPVDVAGFLAARTYPVRDRLVLDVRDELRPDGGAAGRFVLDAGPDGATCARTDAAADLRLDVATLGSISLGGTSPSVLARAGLVSEETPGALGRADRAFAADRAPFAFTWF